MHVKVALAAQEHGVPPLDLNEIDAAFAGCEGRGERVIRWIPGALILQGHPGAEPP